MAASYSKDFLIAAYTFPYDKAGLSTRATQANAEKLYDQVGKDRFRVFASVDAKAVEDYKKFCLEHGLPM